MRRKNELSHSELESIARELLAELSGRCAASVQDGEYTAIPMPEERGRYKRQRAFPRRVRTALDRAFNHGTSGRAAADIETLCAAAIREPDTVADIEASEAAESGEPETAEALMEAGGELQVQRQRELYKRRLSRSLEAAADAQARETADGAAGESHDFSSGLPPVRSRGDFRSELFYEGSRAPRMPRQAHSGFGGDFARRETARGSITVQSAEKLSEAFCRDARRYDGAFEKY